MILKTRIFWKAATFDLYASLWHWSLKHIMMTLIQWNTESDGKFRATQPKCLKNICMTEKCQNRLRMMLWSFPPCDPVFFFSIYSTFQWSNCAAERQRSRNDRRVPQLFCLADTDLSTSININTQTPAWLTIHRISSFDASIIQPINLIILLSFLNIITLYGMAV